MADTDTTAAVATAKPRNLFARFFGVIVSPRATYADVAAHPRVFGMLLVVALLAGSGAAALMSTDVGKQAWLDAAVRQQESFGRTITDAQYAQLERMQQYAPYVSLVSVVLLPVTAAITAAVLLGVFNALMGGDATFKQVMAVVAHSSAVLPVSQIVALPVAYARETLSGVTNLMVFFPFLDENAFAARFLGTIDLIYVWWIVSLAIGLGVLYKRRTGPIATGFMIVYAAIALIIAAVKTAAAGA
jgi:hypothetical protein